MSECGRTSAQSSCLSRSVSFLGLNRGMAGLLSMVILVGMGERMAERLTCHRSTTAFWHAVDGRAGRAGRSLARRHIRQDISSSLTQCGMP